MWNEIFMTERRVTFDKRVAAPDAVSQGKFLQTLDRCGILHYFRHCEVRTLIILLRDPWWMLSIISEFWCRGNVISIGSSQ